VVRLTFSLTYSPVAGMAATEAWYNAEGTVRLLTDQGLFWEEVYVPLVPLAWFLT
jgi:hypothetical protein